MRVLLADDHGLLRDSIQAYLQKLDPQALIDTAADLDESLEPARGLKPYDLVHHLIAHARSLPQTDRAQPYAGPETGL